MRKFELRKNDFGGLLIVFEGIDGSGKTTSIKFLQQYLNKNGYDSVYVKMPSDRMISLKIFQDYDNSVDDATRNMIDLTNLTIMVSGDRLLVQDEIIIPALKQNKIVICDRYCYTGYVRCDKQIIYQISKRFLQPDLCFLCDCQVNTAKTRIYNRANEKNNYYNVNDAKLQRKRFLSLAKKNNFYVLNTDKDFEITKCEILNYINKN